MPPEYTTIPLAMSRPRQTRRRKLTASQRSLLRRYLADHDVPCPRCEYNLRDLESDSCPECGEPLSYTKVKRGLPRPNDAAMSLTEIGLEIVRAVAIFVSWETAIILTFILILGIALGGVPPIVLWGAGGALAVALLIRMATTRFLSHIERRPYRFSDLPRSAKWTVAVFAVLFAIGALAAIAVYLIA